MNVLQSKDWDWPVRIFVWMPSEGIEYTLALFYTQSRSSTFTWRMYATIVSNLHTNEAKNWLTIYTIVIDETSILIWLTSRICSFEMAIYTLRSTPRTQTSAAPSLRNVKQFIQAWNSLANCYLRPHPENFRNIHPSVTTTDNKIWWLYISTLVEII